MTAKTAGLLAGAAEVPFADIDSAVARLAGDRRRRKRTPARAQTATVVVIGDTARLIPAAEALEHLCESCGVHAILLSEGSKSSPTARVTEFATAIEGLTPRFIDNAVAALRLSSLPMVVWWRGGSLESLGDLTSLADRIVFDVEEPEAVWSQAGAHFEKTAVSDLRWTRLTRWRSVLAHLFDLPQIQARAAAIERLEIEASDLPCARLFAGWLRTAFRWTPATAIDLRRVAPNGPSPLESARLLGSDGFELTLRVSRTRNCIEVSGKGAAAGSSRVVPLGDGALNTLIAEELGVRARDLAFEQALVASLEITA